VPSMYSFLKTLTLPSLQVTRKTTTTMIWPKMLLKKMMTTSGSKIS